METVDVFGHAAAATAARVQNQAEIFRIKAIRLPHKGLTKSRQKEKLLPHFVLTLIVWPFYFTNTLGLSVFLY